MSEVEERAQFDDLVDQLERETLAMDAGGDGSGVHLIFRTVHNLKSLSAFLGLQEASAAFHKLEDHMDDIRRGRARWTPDQADEVFALIDVCRGEPAAPRERAQEAAPAAQTPWGVPLSPEGSDLVADALLEGHGVYRIEKLFRRGLSREDFFALPVMESLAEVGSLVAVHPDWEAYDQGPEEQVVKFLFTSPRTQEEIAGIIFDPLLELEPPQPPDAGGGEDPVRFLVIDDDAATSTLLGHILRKHGSCMVAGSARAGFAEFLKAWERSEPYHIVFLDLRLPDMGGLAILTAIRRFEGRHHLEPGHRCQVVVCTSSDNHEDIKASLSRDADGYMVKPVSPAAIDEKIALLRETWVHQN